MNEVEAVKDLKDIALIRDGLDYELFLHSAMIMPYYTLRLKTCINV